MSDMKPMRKKKSKHALTVAEQKVEREWLVQEINRLAPAMLRTALLTPDDLPPVSVHEIVRQSFSISIAAAVAGAVGKWETHGFAFSKLAAFWQASFP
jgi:hypothetical protein